jgi:hypothetical protein
MTMRFLNALLPLAIAGAGILLAECSASTPSSTSSVDAGVVQDAQPLPTEDAGADASPAPPEASAPACALPPSGLTSSETCSACLLASCCDAISQCFENPACVGINTCLTACFSGVAPDGGLAACEQRCNLTTATGSTETQIAAELACFTGACASACPGPPLCGTPTGSYLTTCNNCQLIGGTMTCDCVNGAGATVVSQLDVCGCDQPPAVANTNGALTCASGDGG